MLIAGTGRTGGVNGIFLHTFSYTRPSTRAKLNGQVRKTRNIQNVTSERQMTDARHISHVALQDDAYDVFESRDQAVASNGDIHFDRAHAS